MDNAQGDPTQELVARAQGGDQDALNELFRLYWPQVLKAVRQRMGEKLRRFEESLDVVQDTLEEAYRSFPDFHWQGEGSFKYWLYNMALNRIRKSAHFFSAQKRGGGKLPGFLKVGAAEMDDGFRPKDSRTASRLALMNERKMRVRRALTKLTSEEREILEMREFLGLSHADIGNAFGIEPDAARMRVVRAKENLVRAIMKVRMEEREPGQEANG